MPGTFVKLYQSIIKSSVWLEDPPTKVVWITMLADADFTGTVWGSLPGLARMAGVSIQECERALRILSSPDPHSSSPEEEGRRVKPVEGGWLLINHGKYRAFRTPRQVKGAARQRRYYQKRKRQPDASDAQIENEIENKKEKQITENRLAASPPKALAKRNMWSHEACDDWISRFGGTAPGGRIGKALEPLVREHGWNLVRPSWQRYLIGKEAEFATAQDFAAHYGLWSGERPPSGKPPLSSDPEVQAFLRGARR